MPGRCRVTPYAGIAIAVVIVAAFGGTYAKGRADGSAVTAAKTVIKIDNQIAEVARKNVEIVKGDQALIVAKTVDKEKIKIIYRTIHDQIIPEIIEVPVYTDRACSIPANGMRLIAQAAAGGMPGDTDQPARNPASNAASAKK